MTAIYPTASEAMAVVRGRNKHPKRYLSVCPRRAWMTGIVAGVSIDSATEGIYALELSGVEGDEAMAEMTVDIGTTPGASDIGRVRVREAGTTTLPIALTAFGDVPVQVGHHVTVREEFRPWQVGFRLIPVYDESGAITDVLEYMDYDNDFGMPHDGGTPKVNLTGGYTPDTSDYLPIKPADWCDAGEEYRTVSLMAVGNIIFQSAATGFASMDWDFGDGEVVSGGSPNAEAVVRFPPGFRYIHCTGTDDLGFQHTMHFPIWAHHKTLYPPIVLTGIPHDVTEQWREMTVEFNGRAGDYAEDVIPSGTACCYWEGRDLFADGDPPISYRDHAYGWVIEDTTQLTLGGGYALTFAGAGWWLDHFDGPTQALRDGGTPSAWHHIREITRDRALFFSLLHFCNIASLVNIRFYGLPFSQATLRINLEPGSIWQQNLTTAARYSVSTIGSDSFGNILVTREYNHLSALERAGLQPLLDLEAQDWTNEGIALTTRHERNYSRVEGAGSIFYLGEVLFASAAPGKVKSGGVNIAQLEGQYLPFYTAQETLNDLTGQRWKALNNPQSGISIPLLNNLDVIEPCWHRPIRISWYKPTVRGTLLQQAQFLVKRVTVEHDFSYSPDTPPKKVIWEVDRTTLGFPGVTIPVIQAEGTIIPEDPDPEPEPGDLSPMLLSGTQTIAAFGSGTSYYITFDFLSASPTWFSVSLAGTLGSGNIQWFEPDPYSPYYLGTGDTVNGWLGFRKSSGSPNCLIYRITDIFGTPALSLQFTLPVTASSWLLGHTERAAPGFVMAITGGAPTDDSVARTVDGANWLSQKEPTKLSGTILNLKISSRNAGVVTASWVKTGGIPDVYRSTDYGQSFPTTIPGGSKHLLHIPHASADDSVIYCLRGGFLGNGIARVEGGVLTQITPQLSGVDVNYSGAGLQQGFRTWDLDDDYGIYVGVRSSTIMNVMTANRFASITQIDNGSEQYLRCNFSGDDPAYSYWWDQVQKPLIGYRAGSGAIASKQGAGAGEIAGGALVRILNICGGPDI